MVAHIFARSPARAPPRAARATPLLAFLAGDFAEAVATIWPAPHADFFALPAARRHAAAIVLTGQGRDVLSHIDLRRLVAFGRDTAVADALAREVSPGLMRALAKAGETLWAPADYHAFLRLMRDPAANEALRHMDQVRPAAFAPLVALPPALRVVPILRVVADARAAVDLALAFRLAIRMRDPHAGPRIARRWAAGGDISTVFRRVTQDLTPDAFRPFEPAPALGHAFERIVTRRQLDATALELRNCLAEHAQRIGEGRMAAYVWREPDVLTLSPACVALTRDVAGWRLADAKAADNADLDEARLRQLAIIVERAGARTGPSVTTLIHRLDDWASGTSYAFRPGDGFIDQLALGDIWS